MSDYSDYNGDTEHDMWVDDTYHENTRELSDWFGGDEGDGMRQPRYRSEYQPEKTTSQLISDCKSRIGSNKAKIAKVEAEIERTKTSIENPVAPPRRKAQLQKLLDVNYPNQLARYRQNIEKDEAVLTSLLIKRETELNRLTIGICILVILGSLFIFWMLFT